MKLDYILIEEICLFKFNRDIDTPMRVNLRDAYFNRDGDIVASCAIGEKGAMNEFFIRADEYHRLLREKKLREIGI
jgi:hypothetical protein